jgi:hypothetical protein
VKDKIVLGDTSFPSKNIAFYCDGSNTYANIGKKIFATQVASGPINVYKFEYTTTHYEGFNNSFSGFNNSVVGGQHTNRHSSYYIQQKDKMDIKFFNLKNLSSMVPPNSPGYDILQKCKAKDKTRKIIKYSSLGLIGIGAAVGGSDAVTGVGLMGAGFVGEIVALVKRVNNYQRMYDAIQVIDSMPADKNILPSHKKVK